MRKPVSDQACKLSVLIVFHLAYASGIDRRIGHTRRPLVTDRKGEGSMIAARLVFIFAVVNLAFLLTELALNGLGVALLYQRKTDGGS